MTKDACSGETTLGRAVRRVTALLAYADHPNTDPIEAKTFRAKAESLMQQYRIDEVALSFYAVMR